MEEGGGGGGCGGEKNNFVSGTSIIVPCNLFTH